MMVTSSCCAISNPTCLFSWNILMPKEKQSVAFFNNFEIIKGIQLMTNKLSIAPEKDSLIQLVMWKVKLLDYRKYFFVIKS